jgi:hypothetical protein
MKEFKQTKYKYSTFIICKTAFLYCVQKLLRKKNYIDLCYFMIHLYDMFV